jgi:hypothetical protein
VCSQRLAVGIAKKTPSYCKQSPTVVGDKFKATIFCALCEHGHQGLTTRNSATNGHLKAVKRHTNGRYYVYDSLQPTVVDLNAAYLQRLQDPREDKTALILLEVHVYAGHSTAPQGLQTLLHTPALRDAWGSTSPWEHAGTLSVLAFGKQVRGFCLPLAISIAVGSRIVSPHQQL